MKGQDRATRKKQHACAGTCNSQLSTTPHLQQAVTVVFSLTVHAALHQHAFLERTHEVFKKHLRKQEKYQLQACKHATYQHHLMTSPSRYASANTPSSTQQEAQQSRSLASSAGRSNCWRSSSTRCCARRSHDLEGDSSPGVDMDTWQREGTREEGRNRR